MSTSPCFWLTDVRCPQADGSPAKAPEPSKNKPPSGGGVLSSDSAEGTSSADTGSGSGKGGDWLEKLTASLNSLEDVLDPGDSGTANDLSAGSGGALDNALASDEEDSFGKIPAEAAPAPVAVNAPAPAKKGLDGFSFSFIDGDESEEDAAAPTGAAATPPKADSGGAGSADFGDSFSFNSTANDLGADEMLSPRRSADAEVPEAAAPEPSAAPATMNAMRGLGSLPAGGDGVPVDDLAPAGVNTVGQRPKAGTGSTGSSGGGSAMPWASMAAGVAAAELDEDEVASLGST